MRQKNPHLPIAADVGTRLFAITTRRWRDRQRLLQAEVQLGFRAQANLLAAGCSLHAGPGASTTSSPDRRAFTAAGNAADNRADGRTSTHLSGRVLAASISLLRPLVGLE